MKLKNVWMAAALVAVSCGVQAQTKVTRTYGPAAQKFANAIWAGDTLYLSGQMANPATPADSAKGTPAVYGDTKTQAISALNKIQALLQSQGLDMKDVVKMTAFLVADPALGNKLDFAGFNAAYMQFFGTKEQPNKPARSAMQAAALVTPWGLVEIDVIAVRSK